MENHPRSSSSSPEYEENKIIEDENDYLLQEMTAIAQTEDYIGSLTELEILFVPIKSFENLKLCHNLIHLCLIKTRTPSIEGIETGSHSLETLTMIDGELEIMENSFTYLTNLREINLSENNIPSIQNLGNGTHLEKLVLTSNKIQTVTGLESNTKLKELHLQDNLISKVEEVALLPNLQILYLSGNKIKNLNDLKEIEGLKQLKRLAFACGNFGPGPVSEIQGYRQYVLTMGSQSPYLEGLDSTYLTEDDVNYSKNEFIESILDLQKSLEEIEKSHRHSVLAIDSKLRENEQHLEDIEDTLVEELNNFRHEIEEGKAKLLNEFEKLKKLRTKSEDTFLKSLKEIEGKYEGVMNTVLEREEQRYREWERGSQGSISSLEYQRDVHITLTDSLYSTNGKVIHSEILSTSPEFTYLEQLVSNSSHTDQKIKIRKAFHVNFTNTAFEEKLLGPRMFINLTNDELSTFLVERKLPEFSPNIVDEKFPGEITLDMGDSVIIAVKGEKRSSGTGNPVLNFWRTKDFSKIVIEFVMIISGMSQEDEKILGEIEQDQRIVDVIGDSSDLPAESLAMIRNLEREIFEKFSDHERRVWGELEPNALTKYKTQQEELSKLYSSLQTLKTKIDEERSVQEKILNSMREALIDMPKSNFY